MFLYKDWAKNTPARPQHGKKSLCNNYKTHLKPGVSLEYVRWVFKISKSVIFFTT